MAKCESINLVVRVTKTKMADQEQDEKVCATFKIHSFNIFNVNFVFPIMKSES